MDKLIKGSEKSANPLEEWRGEALQAKGTACANAWRWKKSLISGSS